jgi:hypothetical protein
MTGGPHYISGTCANCDSREVTADSEPFRTPVPIESVHRFRRFRTPAEETLLAAGAR